MNFSKLNALILGISYFCVANCTPQKELPENSFLGVYGTVVSVSDVQTLSESTFEQGNVIFIRKQQWNVIAENMFSGDLDFLPDYPEKWDFFLTKQLLVEQNIVVADIKKDGTYQALLDFDNYIICLANLVNSSAPINEYPIHIMGCAITDITKLPMLLNLGYGEFGAFIRSEDA